MEDRQRNNNGIRITTRELYDTLRRLEERMQELLSQKELVKDLNDRVRKLEFGRTAIYSGALGILVVGGGAAVWKLVG